MRTPATNAVPVVFLSLRTGRWADFGDWQFVRIRTFTACSTTLEELFKQNSVSRKLT